MRYLVLAFLCAAAVIAYVQRLGFNVAERTVRGDLGLDREQVGRVMAAWSLGYALLQLPSGWLADRFGSRRVLTALALAWSALTGLVGLAWDFHSLLVLWFCMGLAQAGVFPCSAKSIGQWFGDCGRASAAGLLGSSMALGSAIAPALTGLLVSHHPWPLVFVAYAAVGILSSAAYFAAVPDAPAGPGMPPSPPPAWARRDWFTLVTSVPMILLCGQQFFRACGMAFFYTWFATFLQETRGVNLAEAGLMTGAVGLGAVAGGVLGGLASDGLLRRTGNRRQGLAVAGLSLCSVLVPISAEITSREVAAGVLTLGAFAAAFGGVSGYTVAIEFGGKRVATVFSVMNTCGNTGAALFPAAVGTLLDATGDWDPVLYLFAGVLALDAILWALLNPRHPLFRDDDEPHRHPPDLLSRRHRPR
jgi:sugar phosphate permease